VWSSGDSIRNYTLPFLSQKMRANDRGQDIIIAVLGTTLTGETATVLAG
jgi:hypothetical protein